MKTQNLTLAIVVISIAFSCQVFSQNVSISEDESYVPEDAAMLDIYSQNKGLLIPRIALIAVDDPVLATKPEGLMVWNTSTTGTYAQPGFYYWNGTDWVMVGSTSYNFSNGLTESSGNVKLGGTLGENTTITQGNYGMVYNLTGTGDFEIRKNGASGLFVRQDGYIGIGTNTPLKNVHINGETALGSLLITPNQTSFNSSSELILSEDHDNSYNMSIKYDGNANKMMIYSKENSNNYGPHVSITRKVGAVGIGTDSPASSSLLDITSTEKGMLVPRMTTEQREAISSPANGLLVYDTDKVCFYYYNGAKSKWVNLNAVGSTSAGASEALFAVTNTAGDTVFAVFEEGVRINVGDGGTKASRGGFAVATRSTSKAGLQSLLTVDTDSTRIYIDENISKASRGGFAVATRSTSKDNSDDVMFVSPNSTNIYIDTTSNKASRGGFAVATRSTSKNTLNSLLTVTPDSTRVYIDKSNTDKASRGGFAVATRSTSKESADDVMIVTANSTSIFVDTVNSKASRGGFAVATRSTSKAGSQSLLMVNKDSTRVYIDESAKNKASRGGFAVATRSTSKAGSNDVLMITKDSSRVYIADDNAGFGVENTSSNTKQRLMRLNKENYFIGHRTGIKTTHPIDPGIDPEGRRNTFIGYNSGVENQTGYQNVFLGYVAGFNSREESNRNVFIGSNAGQENYNSSDNVFIGFGAGLENGNATGANDNVFLGSESGYNNRGSRNVFIGKSSGYSNSQGIDNVFMGHRAGYSNTLGSYNVFVGEGTGDANTEGINNVFMGQAAGNKNIDGNSNVLIGKAAGFLGISNDYNVFIGDSSGYSTEGSWANKNVFVGYATGKSNVEGGENVFIGNACGYTNTGGYKNVFIGAESGYNNTSGRSNVFIGDNAGYNNTEGEFNVFIGKSAGTQNETGRKNLFLGYESGQGNVSGHGNVYLGEAAGQAGTIADSNTFVGAYAGQSNSTANSNVNIGAHAGSWNMSGGFNTNIGTRSGMRGYSKSHCINIGHQAGWYETNSYRFYLGINGGTDLADGIEKTFLYGEFDNKILRVNADLGIGTHTPDGKLHIYNPKDSWDEVNGIIIDQHGAEDNIPFRIRTNTTDPTTYTNADTKFVINGIGNVGIGTTWPEAPLDIETNTSGYAIHIEEGTGTDNEEWQIGVDATGDLNFYDGTTQVITFEDGGFVGIGIANPVQPLHVIGDAQFGGGSTNYDSNSEVVRIDGQSDSWYMAVQNETTAAASDFFIGKSATEDGIFHIANNGNIGIGTSEPGIKLDISGAGDIFRVKHNLYDHGLIIDPWNSTTSAVNIDPAEANQSIYFGRDIDASSWIFESGTVKIASTVGIGRDASSLYGLYVDGGTSYEMRVVGTAHASVSFVSDSDKRWKKNIKQYNNALEKVLKIRAVNYEFRVDEFPENGFEKGIQTGFIAQEIETEFPEFIYEDEFGFKGVDYSKFSSVLVEATKEQQKIIESQQAEIENLKKEVNRINELEKQLQELKELIQNK